MKRHSLLLTLATLLTLQTLLMSQVLPSPKPGDPDYFPITAWGGLPYFFDQKQADDMAEAGITVAGFASTVEQLDCIQKAGMVAWGFRQVPDQYFWDDEAPEEELRKGIRATVDFFQDHPALCGYFIQDEPSTSRFRNLAIMADEVKKARPGKDAYINLFPNYATPKQLGAADWKEYAERFIQELQPAHLGYDYYTLFEGNDPIRRGTWQQLAEAREVTLAHGIPLDVCLLSVGHMPYRIPSENDLFFQVYSALLYGAKGILYFTYYTPSVASYRHAPIDPWGNRTETWYAMRFVNNTVKCIAKTLNRLESTKVYHFVPNGRERLPREDAPEETSLIAAPAADNQDIAVGEFRDRENGEIYVMVLNKNLERSTSIADLQWRNGTPADIQVVSQFRKDTLSRFAGENVWLAPGQALLLKITE